MRDLSLRQPHGSLLVTGAKPFETRHWATKVRGEILLHAAQRKITGEELQEYLHTPWYQCGLAPLNGLAVDFTAPPSKWVTAADLAYGAFVGIGELVGCIRTEEMTGAQRVLARGFGDFSPGRFAWKFVNVRRFARAIPGKGRQGFFFAAVDLRGVEVIEVTDGEGRLVEKAKG